MSPYSLALRRAGWKIAAGTALIFWIPSISSSQQTQTTPPAEPVRTSITVTEQVETEAPAAITQLTRPDISQLPGINLDDRLRLIPGFSLFRRSSSLVANPTTQGISLRGLGSSGASRTLTLWDGIPLNSPFGGWVYWTRVYPEDLERLEVVRGASTAVFGDRAMGGGIGLFSREPGRMRGSTSYEGGNENSHQLTASGSMMLGSNWAISGQGRGFTTDGYYIVPATVRGPIDTEANVKFGTGLLRLDYLGARDKLFFRADMLTEERDNGTQLTQNSSGLGTIAANYSHEQGPSTFTALGYHSREEYRATFSSIGTGRQTERLTSRQSVPAEATGGAGMWRYSNSRWNLLTGGDFQRVEGYSIETLYPTGSRVGGGTQTQYGFFGQTDYKLGIARLFGGLRGQDAGNGTAFWSPSGGVTVGIENWRLRTSAYRAFRAPTLNELFREFRVGNAVTLANPLLKPESLWGVEAGADYVNNGLRVSVGGFDNHLSDLITNVTLSSTPSLITRKRDNAGSARSRGIEASVSKHWGAWLGEASYLFVDARYATGERVPQIPKHQGSAILSWSWRNTSLSGGLRSNALQFEDDRNTFILPGFAVFHATARQRLGHGVSATAALENAFNREYSVGYSPTPLIGAPRLWRLGLRWDSR